MRRRRTCRWGKRRIVRVGRLMRVREVLVILILLVVASKAITVRMVAINTIVAIRGGYCVIRRRGGRRRRRSKVLGKMGGWWLKAL